MVQCSWTGSFGKVHGMSSSTEQAKKKRKRNAYSVFLEKPIICDVGVTPRSGSMVISCCFEHTTAGSPANHWHLAWLMTGQHRRAGTQTRPSEWHHRREPGVQRSLRRQRQQKAKLTSCRNLKLGNTPPPPYTGERTSSVLITNVLRRQNNFMALWKMFLT